MARPISPQDRPSSRAAVMASNSSAEGQRRRSSPALARFNHPMNDLTKVILTAAVAVVLISLAVLLFLLPR
jgi:hypothetical protein